MGKITKLHPRNNLLKVGIDTPTLMALDRFSEAIGRPKSRIVAEMLSGISPMLNQFADSANRLKQVTDGQHLAATVSQLSKEIDVLLERVHNG
jgi:predicted DNA-binding protein